MPSAQFKWPLALKVLLGLEGPGVPGARTNEVRRHIALELNPQAARYWAFPGKEPSPPDLRAAIRDWYSRSPEWKTIVRERKKWARAGARVTISTQK